MALGKAQWSEARSWAADVRYFDMQLRHGLAKLDAVVHTAADVRTGGPERPSSRHRQHKTAYQKLGVQVLLEVH